ncbi:helix-turn-helix domain-containing protein [Sporosarcina sp. Marseille-Q4943]|uniref:helix-turn-helix domain-containing protein n=1 Tax=Sporosarcina sp. Marseille-Q4943 TaxID=2942204 RepID=UPI00208DCD43|nr:helix-turn-helix transcriptional regulator [Sporosarcina sp. Marseille-Q4943]
MFSESLKALRKKKKMSQQEMADFLGITRQGYAKYESGESEPSFATLEKIALFFGVTTDDLLGFENTINVAGKDISLTDYELKLFNELKKHPIMLHDLATDPEKKVKELIKLYEMKKMFFENDEDDSSDDFGDLED